MPWRQRRNRHEAIARRMVEGSAPILTVAPIRWQSRQGRGIVEAGLVDYLAELKLRCYVSVVRHILTEFGGVSGEAILEFFH